jgi:hypothetical protein
MLERSFGEYLRKAADAGDAAADWRDVLVALAPFYDCAVRLGLDPVDLFDRASAGSPDDLRRLVQGFARRSDITLDAFDWTLTMLSDGPCYEPT